MCIRRANEISTLIGMPSYFINANVKGRTRVHGRKWEAHASEQPSTVRMEILVDEFSDICGRNGNS